MAIITIPNSLGLQSVIAFSTDLDRIPHGDEFYDFDFQYLSGWFPPFSMVYLAAQLRRFKSERPYAQCRALNFADLTYAAHMGFFRSFGLEYGNNPGQASGNDNYVPITSLNCDDIRTTAAQTGLYPGEILQNRAEALAQIVTRGTIGPFYDFLSFSLREVLRNAVEHSGSSEVLYCAQYWPRRGEVEVGIADFGIGVRSGLANNPLYRSTTNQEALALSLQPGVSGRAYPGAPPQSESEWENSGWGLYMTSELLARTGTFFIASQDAALLKATGLLLPYQQRFMGTCIRLSLFPARLTPFRQAISEVQAQGLQLLQGGLLPSRASTRL